MGMTDKKETSLIPLQLAALFDKKKVIYSWRKLGLEGDMSWLWDAPGDLPLHNAARAGDTATIETLLQEGANLSAENKQGHTALWVAAQAGHVRTVKSLLQFKLKGSKLPDGDDAILATRNVDVIRAVLAVAPLAAMGRIGAKALKQVAREGNVKMVQCLLEAGANPNGGDDMEWLFPDFNPNLWGAPGDRALHWAARAGQLVCVQLLIKGGACITTLNRKYESALEVAAKAGECNVVEFLLRSGADSEERQMKFALRNARSADVAKVLAEALVQFDGGGDMVWIMANEGEPLILEALVCAGSQLNAHFLNGWTPLHAAVRNLHFSCIELLINGGADINAKDKTGQTPLHDAAELGNSRCVQVLLASGARRGSRDRNWKIPRDYTKDPDLYELLSHKRKIAVPQENVMSRDSCVTRDQFSENNDVSHVRFTASEIKM